MPQKENILTWQRVPAHRIQFKRLDEEISFLLMLPTLVYFGLWKYSMKDLLLGIRPTRGTILSTILMMGLGFFLNASHLGKISAHYHDQPDAMLRVVVGVIIPLFTAGIPEEFFFRGYLQTRLEKKWNRVFAILLTSVLFTAWHLPSRYLLAQGVEGQAGHFDQVLLHTGLPVLVISLIFGFHWSRYRNIVL
jgi:membrane protease YdiL (CAAX protease family)